jgi:uncharacterized membrane protein YphA (DoxX/SURF4 family)
MLVNEARLQSWSPWMRASCVSWRRCNTASPNISAFPPTRRLISAWFLLIGLAGAIELIGSLLLLVGLWSRAWSREPTRPRV